MIRSALTFTSLGLGAAASAIIPRGAETTGNTQYGWGFTLYGHGPVTASGHVGQLKDGQCRFGRLPLGNFIFKDGVVWDSKHRGCILTPETTQWQCDEGSQPTPGFEIGCDGYFKFLGSSKFFACPVNDKGEWNIYLHAIPSQRKCVEITLQVNPTPPAGLCSSPHPTIPLPHPPAYKPHCPGYPPGDKTGDCTPPPPSPFPVPPYPLPPPEPKPCDEKTETCKPPQPPYPRPPFPKPSCHGKECGGPHKECPLDLSGKWEFPHLIVPVSQSRPNEPFGNKLNGYFRPDVCTIFNFDVHPDYAGETCSVIFLLPKKKDLKTSDYTYTGEGNLVFLKLDEPATVKTTWANKPEGEKLGKKHITPGSKTEVWSGPCEAGKRVAFAVCADGDLEIEYFQDFNPAPIGLYMPVCE